MAVVKTKAGTYKADLSFIVKGKRRRVQKTFKRKGDAEAWLIKQKTLRAQGINKKSTHFSWLFDHYYKIYKEPFIRPNTKSTWSLSRKAFIKYFGEDEPVSKVTHDRYQNFITEYGKNHTRASVTSISQKCSEVFNYAVRERYIPISPADGVRISGEDPRHVTYLTTKEIKKVLRYIANTRFRRRSDASAPIGTPYMIMAAILTGARLSELAGLRWEDIDAKRSIISITHQVDLRGDLHSKSTKLMPLKTKSSKRKIPVPKSLISQLEKIKAPTDTFVFHTQQGGLCSSSTESYQLKVLLKACEIDAPGFHFHSLRHSHVALLLSQDVDIYAISKRLGHSSFQTTLNTYAYLIDEKKKQEDEKIIGALNKVMK